MDGWMEVADDDNGDDDNDLTVVVMYYMNYDRKVIHMIMMMMLMMMTIKEQMTIDHNYNHDVVDRLRSSSIGAAKIKVMKARDELLEVCMVTMSTL
jgi:hypothetical protein